jgi:hypothetical protein
MWRRGRRRRMYYCGGPYKEQAGTLPTYTHPMYATVVYGPSLRKHKHKCAPKHRTKELGKWGRIMEL